MTVVVADTSPLNYLVLIGQIEILHDLYTRVLVPPEVLAELAGAGAPHEVLDWISPQPEWLEVCVVRQDQSDPALQHIDPGERAAILLAQDELDVLLLIDDAAGRAEASRRRIPNTGTLGVLRAAAPGSTRGSSDGLDPTGGNELPRIALSDRGTSCGRLRTQAAVP